MGEDNTPITLKKDIEPESKENIDQIMERLKNIQPELRDYVLGPSYANDFLNIIKTYSLAPEYVTELESITTMTLLGFIPPKEVREEVHKSLPSISSSVKDGICEYIFNNILTKERVAVLERNWQEDDAIEKEIEEYFELQDVPRPETIQGSTPKNENVSYNIRPNPVITEEKLVQNIKNEATEKWEEKLKMQNSQISERVNVDASIPKVVQNNKKVDLYREIPE